MPGSIDSQLVLAPNVLAEATLHRDLYAWSPDGKTIAYCDGGVRLVRRTDRATRTLSSRCFADLEWSPDGRFLAVRADGVDVIDTRSGSTRTLDARWDADFEWAPRRSQLALGLPGGLELYSAATGTKQLVTRDNAAGIVWSPRGNALAYVARRNSLVWGASDVRVADLTGNSHTVVPAAGPAGGDIAYLTWTRWPRTGALPQPRPRFIGRATSNELSAPWAITRLESDGERVAYVACNHVFVWSPGSATIRQAEPAASLMPRCSTPGPPQYVISYEIFDVGIAGDAVVYGEAFGCLGGAWSFTALTLAAPGDASELHRGSGSRCGSSFDVDFGEAVGSDSLLVYSTWRGHMRSASPREEKITEYQDIRRVGGDVIAAREGTLVPLDVHGGRIAVSRGTTFAMLDETGRELWSVAVDPRAAVFTRDELVLIHAGEALRYVAATGAFLGSMPFQVGKAVGRPCQTPHWQWCDFGGVTIHDGANGFVAYEVSGRVRVLRVSDGQDRDVAAGRLAAFTSQGLVVADGARLRLTPFAELW